ncbi:MAG: D-glycero-beta-D-manno-heptose 1-phosphate adenylyltransferase [Candidatus Auribacter fodinae]|jgi:D-beta-D-heptose 7-phosphate kinase/D-beta-D-heptose 1-phosphate adenosyltransferase|uniref:D-glycero-beta-D-manno-heptose 1-phosphate adenylyltransferase n=1 Tax=Candidatus Auribacter fodinae TaxID=2093366 RepID=A0A3A4R2D3_9BACT|nr:MAG: D-glycero-beta-D-manno-heptose 1-phosphate adenylyltransferase [Candidatus Auribacter fodinae]
MIDKIISDRNELAEILAELKSNNKKIVFTNGCFDLIHVGHIRYLQECKKNGDLLVVGINTDHSVRINKGDTRPVLPLADRAEIIAALEMVDFVVPFDEKTPFETIRILKPNILIKGGDYTLDTIVGKDDVISWGGEVLTIPLIEGKSTSSIIDRVLQKFGKKHE